MGGQAKPEIETTSALSGGQEQLANQLSGWYGGQIGRGLPGYSGQLSMGPSQLQRQGFAAAGDYMNQPTQPLLGQAQSTLSDLMDPGTMGGTSFDEYFRTNIQGPSLRTFREDTLPAIQEAFAGTGGTYSGRVGLAAGEAGGRLGESLAAQRAGLLYQGEQTRMGAAQGATALGGLLGQQRQSQISMGLGAGDMQRQIQMQGIQARYQEFIRTTPGMNPALSQALGFLGQAHIAAMGMPGEQNDLPDWAGVLSAGAGGWGLGNAMGLTNAQTAQTALSVAAMASDIRVKNDIKPITGALDKLDQLKGCTYRYTHGVKGFRGDDREAGIIAQDLEAVLPEGVFEKGDVKHVILHATIGLLVEAVKELHAEVAELRGGTE